jgi:alpha-beta hydrolase superfamily lysophospholipase
MPGFDGATGPVYYREWPVAEPRASVVFVHGIGEHSGLYARFAAALNAAGSSVWALDLPGHGRTRGEPGVIPSMDGLDGDVTRLATIAARQEPAPVVLAGHSLGGITAALNAARQPSRYAGLVLSGTALSEPPRDYGGDFATAVDDAFDMTGGDLSADPEYLAALASDPLVFTGGAAMAASLRRILPPAWAELATTVPGLRLPVLQVHGEMDQVVPVELARAWTARLPRARLITIPGARHDVLNDTAHQAVAEAIAGFIATVTSSPVYWSDQESG